MNGKGNSSAYRRDVSKRKAMRKRRIAREIYYTWSNSLGEEWEWFDNLHQYSKNKIHCSCPACQTKTRNKGSRRNKVGNYMRSLNYKASELKRIISMDEDEMEYTGRNDGSKRKNDW